MLPKPASENRMEWPWCECRCSKGAVQLRSCFAFWIVEKLDAGFRVEASSAHFVALAYAEVMKHKARESVAEGKRPERGVGRNVESVEGT